MTGKKRHSIASQIAKAKCIPQTLMPLLHERLPIVCELDHSRLIRQNGQVRAHISRQRYTKKKAQENYLHILETRPGHFLGYILTISPRSASENNISTDVLDSWTWPEQYLNDEIQKMLDDLAHELGLIGNPTYGRMLTQLKKPRDSTINLSPIPNTTALNVGGNNNFVYKEPNFETFRLFAEDWLYDLAVAAGDTSAIDKSRLAGVRVQAAYGSCQDAIIWIKIGRADEVLQRLFPHAATTIQAQEEAYSVADGEGEPWFYVSGASVSAFDEVCPKLNEHVGRSELRIWERNNGRMDRTDCVTMKKNIARSAEGLLRVRVSVISVLFAINQMFKT
ncbi:hypothetical protein F66182_4980 [Fusarium sp. NRRL 66182]|nr:hypothetical protein F66182_4980 [Fusarium sp. NRRL 66182]